MTEKKIGVKIIVYGLKEAGDTLESRMVNTRLEDLEAEFEHNGIAVRVIKR